MAAQSFTNQNIMRDPGFIDEQRNADLLDAMADTFANQQEAMRESNPQEWIGYEPELSDAEVNACITTTNVTSLPTVINHEN